MIELKEFENLVKSLGCTIDRGYTSIAYSNYTHRQIAFYNWQGYTRILKMDRYVNMDGIDFYTLETFKKALIDELSKRKMFMLKIKKESIERDFI